MRTRILHRIRTVRSCTFDPTYLFLTFFLPRSDPPYSDGGLPFPNSHHRRSVHSPLHFRTGAAGTTTRTLSDRMMAVEPFVFVEAEEVRQADYEYVPPPANASNSTLNVPAKTVTRSRDVAPPVYAGHRLSWHPPVDASLRFYE